MKREIWELRENYAGSIDLLSSGMVILQINKDQISVGYSQQDRLERIRLISAAPELLEIVNIAKRLIASDNLENWQRNNFSQLLVLVENKINGIGEINKPLHCRATYEWTDKHIEDYHDKVKKLEWKL